MGLLGLSPVSNHCGKMFCLGSKHLLLRVKHKHGIIAEKNKNISAYFGLFNSHFFLKTTYHVV